MPELIEQMYCSQQIVIPPKFPYILKRYCKAAIKTQPYDLLRWSFEYFKALAEHRKPPVKLRLEYPIYSTEGGLTRGCLKVLAHQLLGMPDIPFNILKQAWQGFCLDPQELKRILCLCEVYLRQDAVPYFNFLAVAGGLLTKCLTHTMILLCESLTKEPDGGSAAIPVNDFLVMYRFLAKMDASKDVKYYNGYREGVPPVSEERGEEELTKHSSEPENEDEEGDQHVDSGEEEDEDFWEGQELQRLTLINDRVGRSSKLSEKMNQPVIGKIDRSPSIERMREIERDNYLRERKGRAVPSEDIDKKLRELSTSKFGEEPENAPKDDKPKEQETVVETTEEANVDIFVYDEDENPVQYEIYGEPTPESAVAFGADLSELLTETQTTISEKLHEEGEGSQTVHVETEADKAAVLLQEIANERTERLADIEQTFDEIANIVDKFMTVNYDLGMVAGRQMSTTSGEFIVQHIERDIMAYIDEQIAILPDPDLKKKKAKPEEVQMVRDIVEQFFDDNMDIIVPDVEEVEEEEAIIPEITTVYAVPGIGGPVDIDIMSEFEDYAKEVTRIQANMIMPRNLRHFLCPPLEKYVDQIYEGIETKSEKKEEVATGGAFTD